jgi:dimethylamine monooxygenase subunit A
MALEFDFDHIAVPFRMRPGLARLEGSARQLTPLDPTSPLHEEKRRVMAAGQSRLAVPGFDPGPALGSIAERAALEGIAWHPAGGTPLELRFEEDFAVLDGQDGTLPWLCVCTPSHWAPEEKLGLPFAAVHAPVADSALLVAASKQLVALATEGGRWERHVWTLSPSGRHDQHPRRHGREPWPADASPQAFARGCFLRVERQTFFPVGRGTRQAVFTIRVQLAPLMDAVDSPQKAQRLHDSLASMSDAIATYKGLAAARPMLLRWLAERASA